MTVIRKWIAGFHLNAIALKELRQVTRSRALMALMALYLSAMVIAVVIAIGSEGVLSGLGRVGVGASLFKVLMPVLALTSFILVPLHTGVRLASEHSDTHLDLMFTTPLTAAAIVRGKLLSGIILLILVFSVCAPFMVCSYLLRGVDLLAIAWSLVIVFVLSLLSIQAAILVAVLPARKLFKIIAALAFAGLAFCFLFPLGFIEELVVDSGLGFSGREFWTVIGTIFGFVGMLFAFLHSLSVAMVMPPASNRSFPVRITLFIIWLLSAAIIVAWAVANKRPSGLEPWMALSTGIASMAVLLSICEPDTAKPRILNSLPRSRSLRWLAYFFFTGAGGGIAFSCAIMAVSYVAYLLLYLIVGNLGSASTMFPTRSSHPSDMADGCVVFFTYILAYSLTAVSVRRFIFRDRIAPKFTTVVAMGLIAAGSILPGAVGIFMRKVDMDRGSLGIWMLGNPATSWDTEYQGPHMIVVLGWSLIMLLVNRRWFLRQFSEFISGRATVKPGTV